MHGRSLLTHEQQEISVKQRLNKLGFNYSGEAGCMALMEDVLDHIDGMSAVLQSAKRDVALLQCQVTDLSARLDHQTAKASRLDHAVNNCWTEASNTGLWPTTSEFNNQQQIGQHNMEEYTNYRLTQFERSFSATATQLALLKTDNHRYEQEIMNLRLELKKKLFSEDELSRQLGISQASLKDSILENSKLNSNLSDLSLDNENIKRENADLKSEILQTQKCLNETDTELSEYKSQHVTLVEVRNSLRSQVSDLTTKLEDASSSAVKYEKELDENKIENSRLTKIIKEKEAQIKEYTQKLLADQIQIDDLHVRLKVGLLTADRIRQAEAKQRETAEKLVRSEERLCLVQQDYYQANKFHSKSEVEAKKSKSKLQNQVESACSQLDNLQAENTANIALFEKLREKLVLSKEISFLVDPGCPEGREDIVETICSLLHDLESQSFVLTLQNKRLLEESETAIESNEKLWSDVEQLMEEVLRLKSTKEAPLFTNVAAECLDEYIKASYADDSPLNHSKPGYHPDIEAYRRLINELQQSAEINSQGIASPTPAYPDTTDTHNLNSIPPNLANRQMSNITNNLSVNRDDRSLRQTSTGHQIIQDKSQKQKRSLNQKCIRQRIAAMANELENLKVVYFDLENYCLMKNKMQDKL